MDFKYDVKDRVYFSAADEYIIKRGALAGIAQWIEHRL